MRITVDAARVYFQHPSQRVHGIDPDNLPDDGFEYWALGPVCGIAHLAPWPDVWMTHYAVLPGAKGGLVAPALTLLRAFWAEKQPVRIIGWTDSRNRAALAFNKRLGFVVDGSFPANGAQIIMQGWAV